MSSQKHAKILLRLCVLILFCCIVLHSLFSESPSQEPNFITPNFSHKGTKVHEDHKESKKIIIKLRAFASAPMIKVKQFSKDFS
jgi:hypothetical protein